jgi:hypothetical protein
MRPPAVGEAQCVIVTFGPTDARNDKIVFVVHLRPGRCETTIACSLNRTCRPVVASGSTTDTLRRIWLTARRISFCNASAEAGVMRVDLREVPAACLRPDQSKT